MAYESPASVLVDSSGNLVAVDSSGNRYSVATSDREVIDILCNINEKLSQLPTDQNNTLNRIVDGQGSGIEVGVTQQHALKVAVQISTSDALEDDELVSLTARKQYRDEFQGLPCAR